jgi:hypothetical protein
MQLPQDRLLHADAAAAKAPLGFDLMEPLLVLVGYGS